MKTTIIVLTVIMSIGLSAGFANAEAEKWEIDNAHSNFYFDIRHTFATVRGHFEEFTGAFMFDPDTGEVKRVEFTVQVDSINTNINRRDDHLRSDDFFAAGKFPTITFASTSIRHAKNEENRYVIEGNLTIKGVTKKITEPFTFLGMRENPLKKDQKVAGFETEFTIDRLDYNVGSGKYAEMGVVGKEVNILVTLEVLK